MIALLLLALAPRDEMSDLIARLRAAPEAQQFTLGVQIAPLAKLNHLPLLAKEADAGPDALRPFFIRAIGRVGGNEAKTVLRGLCLRNDFGSRAEAATQLARLQDEFGPKALLELLPKASSDAEKITVLGHLYAGGTSGVDVVPVLVKFLDKETSEAVRRQAVRVLSTHKDAAVHPLLRKIAADAADPARFEALAELIRRGHEGAAEEALKGLEDRKADVSATYQILSALEQSNKKSVLPRLRELLEKADDRTLRIALLRTLATMKDDKALPLITKLSEDKDPEVAKVATESVVRLSGRGQMETLKKAADDADPLKRLDAAEALLQADSAEGWKVLKAALEEGSPAVKSRVLTILTTQRRRESLDLLATLLDDPLEYVRNSARSTMVSTLSALYPYLKFDYQAPADKLKAWWEKNRKN
jgi:HEAT repeat protein